MEIEPRDDPSDSTKSTPGGMFDTVGTKGLVLGLASLLQFLMLAIVGLRLYAKHTILRHWKLDDLTSVLAAISTSAFYIVACFSVTTAATDSVTAGSATDSFYITYWLAGWISALAFVFAKLSFFILYLQIFRPIRLLRIYAWAGVIYCTALWGFVFFFRLIATTPQHGQPWSAVESGWAADTSRRLVLVTGPVNVLSDLHILVLPLLGLRKSKLEGRQKTGVLCISLAGVLAIIASIVSLNFRVRFADDHTTYSSFYTIITCALVELQISVCCASLPAASALARHHFATSEDIELRYRGISAQSGIAALGTTGTGKEGIEMVAKSVDVMEVMKARNVMVGIEEIDIADDKSLMCDGLESRSGNISPSAPSEPDMDLTQVRPGRNSSLGSYPGSWTPIPVKADRGSRRESLLRATSPWGFSKDESDDDNPLAALGNNILVSTQVTQETRRNSMEDLAQGDVGKIRGVTTVIESPRDQGRLVESQILEAVSGAYGGS